MGLRPPLKSSFFVVFLFIFVRLIPVNLFPVQLSRKLCVQIYFFSIQQFSVATNTHQGVSLSTGGGCRSVRVGGVAQYGRGGGGVWLGGGGGCRSVRISSIRI